MSHRHHAIDYVELTVGNLLRAKEFYAAAFGWEFNDYGPQYAGIVGEVRELGGLAEGQTTPGGPLIVLFSENLEKSVKAVVDAGGAISKELFTFPGGRRFHFTDPSGNELAVWSEA